LAAFDEDSVFAARPVQPPTHIIGQTLDDMSAPELTERIALLKREIERLEAAIRARQATREAASAFFKR
jgi:uncharacterized small protein (DUF1192 family)